MPRTLLQIVQQAQNELGLPQSSSVIGNTDATTMQMLALLTGLSDELRRMKRWANFEWEFIIEVTPAVTFSGTVAANSNIVTSVSPNPLGLIQPWVYQCQFPGIPTPTRVVAVAANQLTISLVSPNPQAGIQFLAAQDTYAMPVDFDFFTNRTGWDRTNRWELLGPDSPQMDQWHQSGVVPTGPRRHWRRLGPFASNGVTPGAAQGQFRLWPAPYEIASNLQLVWEYTSLFTVATAGNFNVPAAGYENPANFSQFFTTDSDQSLLNDDLLIKGLKWKFWEAKGFNYTNMKNDWLDYVDFMYARDKGAKTLNLVKRVNPIFISPANVQDGFFPGPTGPAGM